MSTTKEETITVSNVKGTASDEAGTDIQSIMNDLASLRDEFATLTKHVSNNAYEAGMLQLNKLELAPAKFTTTWQLKANALPKPLVSKLKNSQ